MPDSETRESIQRRKQAHLDCCLDPTARTAADPFKDLVLPYNALFEVPDSALDTTVQVLGKTLKFPLMFGAMTGGIDSVRLFNTTLRRLASEHGLALCLGSMRAALRDTALIPTYGQGHVDVLFANIGASEIMADTYSPDEIASCCEKLGCCGLMVHLNGLQEFVQQEGNHDFSCNLAKLSDFIQRFPMPVFVKEVGSGIGGDCLQRLCTTNVAGIELACRGGTSWIRIEALRREHPISAPNLEALDQLGYTLPQVLPGAKKLLRNRTLAASGGISNALVLVKCLALGADLCAVAQPWYQIYHDGGISALEAAVQEWIDIGRLIIRSTGAKNLAELRHHCQTPSASGNGSSALSRM